MAELSKPIICSTQKWLFEILLVFPNTDASAVSSEPTVVLSHV